MWNKSAWITVSNKKHTSKKRWHFQAEIDCSQMITTMGRRDLWKRPIAQSNQLKWAREFFGKLEMSLGKSCSKTGNPSLDFKFSCFGFQVTGVNYKGCNWGGWLHLGSLQAWIVEFERDYWSCSTFFKLSADSNWLGVNLLVCILTGWQRCWQRGLAHLDNRGW